MSFNNRDNRGGRKDFGRGGGRGFGGNRGDRQMFQAVCSNCGRECEVPFQPTGSKPVLCNDCFRNANGGSGSSGRNDRPQRGGFGERRSSAPRSDDRFEALNAKLDKILSLLEKRNDQIVDAPVVAEAENVELQPEETIVIEKKKKSKKSDSDTLE